MPGTGAGGADVAQQRGERQKVPEQTVAVLVS
jgi:hypothetical protein